MLSKSAVMIPLLLSQLTQAAVYMAGDSTMAPFGAGGGTGTQGWGVFLGDYLSLPVTDLAVGGRSARSYTREGRFASIANQVKAGDYVIIEFGHNDGGSLRTDNGRSDCPGTGNETCQTVYNGMKETVYTFPHYLESATQLFTSKGATVIISSQTPINPFDPKTGDFTYQPSRFGAMAQLAAADEKVTFIDHQALVAAQYKALGAKTVNTFYPNDHTHTSPAGAKVVTEAFVRGLLCSANRLKLYVKNKDVPGKC